MPPKESRNAKQRWTRAALFALAVVFAAATILYTTLWLLGNRWTPDIELGYDNSPAFVVARVIKDGPAEKAGLRPGDQVLAIDGKLLRGTTSTFVLYKLHRPGDAVRLTVARPGENSPLELTAVFRKRTEGRGQKGLTGALGELLRNSYPVPFVIVGLVVLFLRVEDRRVWHLSLLFASFTPGPGGVEFGFVPPRLHTFALVYQVLAQGMLGPLFYWFFALFPVRSPLDRRAPWLRWVSLAALPLGTLSLGLFDLRIGAVRLANPLPGLFGKQTQMQMLFIIWILGFVTLGVVSLASNFLHTSDPEARRKMRVIFWGTAIAFTPLLTVAASHFFVEYQDPDWLDAAVIVVVFLFPVSFAYAVIKYRVLEIPVLLKRSARYFLAQRGFTILLLVVWVVAVGLFTRTVSGLVGGFQRSYSPTSISDTVLVVGLIFGVGLVRFSAPVVKKATERIDRAFFRSAYDARQTLEKLAEEARIVTSREELAALLVGEIQQALHPVFVAVYLPDTDGNMRPYPLTSPADQVLSPRLPLLEELARHKGPWQISDLDPREGGPPTGLAVFAPNQPECLVSILMRGGALAGLVALGAKLSEEFYSREDKRLLSAVAAQAGTALENIRLASEIADRIDAERRVAREMEIAREVQSRLLPQEAPRLKTLEIAAECIEARAVGGDYFDFLELGPDLLGIVLADVSGKGVHAALLMANLQAHLRSQSGIAPLDLESLLQQVNRMLWKTTAAEHFATLFFAIYDDALRQLAYVNCGHNAPFLLHADGSVQRLAATATVIGVFEEWECDVERMRLVPGDLLAIFSDGVTEAARGEEEFGEARLIGRLQECRELAANEIVRGVFASVQEFGGGVQSDDLTLVIAKARA